MLDVARKKSPVTELEDLPEAFKQLEGFDKVTLEKGADGSEYARFDTGDDSELVGGEWRSEITLPNDLNELKGHIDPLLVLVGVAAATQHLEDKLAELVRYCRSEGKTWTQIGEALGMSKQAAWERFSGED